MHRAVWRTAGDPEKYATDVYDVRRENKTWKLRDNRNLSLLENFQLFAYFVWEKSNRSVDDDCSEPTVVAVGTGSVTDAPHLDEAHPRSGRL